MKTLGLTVGNTYEEEGNLMKIGGGTFEIPRFVDRRTSLGRALFISSGILMVAES